MIALVVLVLASLLVGCPAHGLPPVAGCVPLAQDCRADAPVVCSSSQRWEPASDVRCADVHAVCSVVSGVAACRPAVGAQ